MKRRLLALLGLASLLVVVAPAAAQPQRGGGPAALLAAKSVQEELKLSEDDAKKIGEEIGKLGRDVPAAERGEKVRKILADHLKPEQLKRLNQITWQRAGVAAAIANPDVQSALKLEDGQKAKIKELRESFQKEQGELGQAAENRDKTQALRKKFNEDVAALLTADQKKSWTELLGAEFKGEIPTARRPGGDKK